MLGFPLPVAKNAMEKGLGPGNLWSDVEKVFSMLYSFGFLLETIKSILDSYIPWPAPPMQGRQRGGGHSRHMPPPSSSIFCYSSWFFSSLLQQRERKIK